MVVASACQLILVRKVPAHLQPAGGGGSFDKDDEAGLICQLLCLCLKLIKLLSIQQLCIVLHLCPGSCLHCTCR